MRNYPSRLLVLPLLALGCTANSLPPSEPEHRPTFSRDVAPLLQQHCQSCHHVGGVAPLPLLTYSDAARAAPAIKSAVLSRRMPEGPSLRVENGCSDPNTFQGPRRLLQSEIDTFTRWVDDGALEGDPAELPAPLTFNNTQWASTQPDLVFANDEQGFFLPPNLNRDVFRRFVIEPNFTTDRFLTGFEALPGIGGGEGLGHVVHHVTMFIDSDRKSPEQLKQFQASAPVVNGPGFEGDFTYPTALVGMWFPGSPPFTLGTGRGIRVPKGACLVMEVHYGRVTSGVIDKTRVGVHLADSVAEEFQTSLVKNENILIPAGAKDVRVQATRTFPSEVTLYAVTPHMHQLGTNFRVSIGLPDSEVCLADVQWDFEHQGTYRLTQPMKLPAGTTLRTECTYDNSADNKNQLNSPPQDIVFGKATDREMCQLTVATSRLPAP